MFRGVSPVSLDYSFVSKWVAETVPDVWTATGIRVVDRDLLHFDSYEGETVLFAHLLVVIRGCFIWVKIYSYGVIGTWYQRIFCGTISFPTMGGTSFVIVCFSVTGGVILQGFTSTFWDGSLGVTIQGTYGTIANSGSTTSSGDNDFTITQGL